LAAALAFYFGLTSIVVTDGPMDNDRVFTKL